MSHAPFNSFSEFWPEYVRHHASPTSRALHFVGSTLVLLLAAAAPFSSWSLLALVPVVGYGFAWTGHFLFEGNRPATFHHPLWSLVADWKMWALTLAGRMGSEVERAKRAG